ncbi:hypothetical protein QC762_510244 [Podospora pseudocomata]|uniref:Uncharacterized protein n=1 Tax=Podospora pseudocomata TaxID=2093779 RepID=A0ABR0GE25_9PEZI|nr:hypothetical protein QC762_510244 [Podospora pseudocomata]
MSDSTNPPQRAPRRSPTDSSYYDCDGVVANKNDPNSKSWHYARDVRAQVAAEQPQHPRGWGYPSYFGDKAGLPLAASKPLTHTPIEPGSLTPYVPGTKPGAHRAVYNDTNRAVVDVIYHDPNKPPKNGSKFEEFSKATYVAKAVP